MPLQGDVLPDRPEAGEKFLCAFRIAKASHTTLAFARRLVDVLRPVVQPGGRFYEHVLDVRQLGNFGLCGRITAQLIRDDLARHWAGSQRTLKKRWGVALSHRFCSRMSSAAPCSSTARHSRYGSPRSVTNISSRCHVLPGLRRALFIPVRKALTKLVATASDRLVCHGHTALEEQFLDVAQTQLEAETPANCLADDCGREPMTVVKRFFFLRHAILPNRPNDTLSAPPHAFRSYSTTSTRGCRAYAAF